jgi:hypothetical protein
LDALLGHAERQGFLKSPHRNTIIRADNPADMLSLMVGKLQPESGSRWRYA